MRLTGRCCVQNGLPFHHGHLTSNGALSGKPLRAVDPTGALFESFRRHQVVSGVCYIAAERTGVAEVTCRSTPKVTKFIFGKVTSKVPEGSQRPGSQMAQALDGVVEGLLASGVNATVVRITPYAECAAGPVCDGKKRTVRAVFVGAVGRIFLFLGSCFLGL